MKTSLAGQYQLTVLRLDGSIKHQTPFFNNLITNAGLNSQGSMPSGTLFARVGSGTTPPEVTDTAMESLVASTSSSTNTATHNFATTPYWGRRRYVWTFAVGAIQATISEVGVGKTNLFSRALIVDEEGTPTPITLGPIDQLILTYDFYLYLPVDNTFEFEVNGVLREGAVLPGTTIAPYLDTAPGNIYRGSAGSPRLCRAVSIGSAGSESLGTRQAFVSNDQAASYAYTANNFYRDFYFQFNDTQGSLSGANSLESMYFGSGVALTIFKMFWTPAFNKSNLETVRLEGRIAWGRYQP